MSISRRVGGQPGSWSSSILSTIPFQPSLGDSPLKATASLLALGHRRDVMLGLAAAAIWNLCGFLQSESQMPLKTDWKEERSPGGRWQAAELASPEDWAFFSLWLRNTLARLLFPCVGYTLKVSVQYRV